MDLNLNDFRDVPFKKRTGCAVCQKELGTPLIELPSFPLTEIYTREIVKEKVGFVDQNFYVCEECGHGQLSNIITPEILYGHAYSFRTSRSTASTSGNELFLSFINRITQSKKFKTIMEIGCNDLYLLNSLKSRAEKLVGVDPMLKGREEEFSDDKIKVIGNFFENTDLQEYVNGESLVLSSHNLEHMENPRAMLEKLADTSTDKTVFVFQFPGIETIIEECRFDQIFHHHLHYFSLYSFTYLLNELGLELIDFDLNRPFWGSLLVAFRKASNKNTNPFNCDSEKISPEKVLKHYDLFKKRMELTNGLLERLKEEKLYGYGAILSLPALSYHLKNDFSSFDCILDDDTNKEGLYYLNLPVSIKNAASINDFKDANIIITAINNARQILPKLISLNPKRLILPLNNI